MVRAGLAVMRGNGLQFFRGELPVAVFVKFFDHGGGVGFLAGFHFFHAFGSFRMVLKPFFLHSLSFLLGKLAVPILVKFLQDGGFLGFLGLLDVGLQNGYFLVGKSSSLSVSYLANTSSSPTIMIPGSILFI